MIIATVRLTYDGGGGLPQQIFVTTIATDHTDIEQFDKIINEEYKTALFTSTSQEFQDEHKDKFYDAYPFYEIEMEETPIINARPDNAQHTIAAFIADAVRETEEHIVDGGFDSVEEYFLEQFS